jgi:hypothetical protein
LNDGLGRGSAITGEEPRASEQESDLLFEEQLWWCKIGVGQTMTVQGVVMRL